jgi:FixJ family two-component response regulator
VHPATPFIAIVDDEEPIRRALVRLLRSAGLESEAFESGAAFLESLTRRVPRCVVLDMHMPGLSGVDVQILLAQSWPELPVIFITGHHSAETRDRVLASHPLAYLVKPVHDQLLLDAIATVP